MDRLRHLRQRESGQTLIFVAVLAPVLFAILGLALQGGMAFMEYRHMQAAADVAALMGAQDLPSNMSTAISDACLFSQNNGYDNCSTTGPSTTTVCVPPQSLSPYTGINYGGGNSSCSNSTTGQFDYIEVQIRKPVQLFPIFSQYLGLGNFTLYAHAIARAGTPSPTDYAITILDPTASPGLSLSGGNGVVVVGPVISDSTASNSINTGGSQAQVACNGEWFTTAAETPPPSQPASNLQTQSGGTADFSPPGCLPSGSYDSTTSFFPDHPSVPDPYCSSDSPPTGVLTSADCNGSTTGAGSTMTNCTPCNSTAYYYEWTPDSNASDGYGRFNTATRKGWLQASGPIKLTGDSYEFFPGVYRGDITVTTNKKPFVYLNPGVYTMMGSNGFVAHGANVCIYGSPSCDINPNALPLVHSTVPGSSADCSSADMTNTASANYVAPGTWYYYCSPWGIWDSSLSRSGATGGGPPTTAPTFYNSTTPLNGVTFYFTGGGSFDINASSYMYAAFPNPCPGTGTESAQSVPFQSQVNPTATGIGQTGWTEPSGAVPGASTSYTYPSKSIANIDGLAQSPASAWVYPDTNLTLSGECERQTANTYAGDVWQGEMPTVGGYHGQHLHFLVFARNGGSGVKLNGNGTQEWWGIMYDPGVPGCYKSSNPCQIVLNGSGGGGGGTPFLVGQIVADNATITGSATMEVFYRPCDPLTETCGTGPGSGLVE